MRRTKSPLLPFSQAIKALAGAAVGPPVSQWQPLKFCVQSRARVLQYNTRAWVLYNNKSTVQEQGHCTGAREVCNSKDKVQEQRYCTSLEQGYFCIFQQQQKCISVQSAHCAVRRVSGTKVFSGTKHAAVPSVEQKLICKVYAQEMFLQALVSTHFCCFSHLQS